MKTVKLFRKIVLFVIGTLFSISIFAQSPEREKRIYLLDLTGSMEGRGTGVTYNILSTVKNNLSATLDGIEDKNTEVVIIPFTNIPHEAIHSFVSEKDVLHKSVEKIKVLPGDTNIADAWEEGIRNLDSTKVNYLFLLTDGLHNTGPSKDVLFERLSSWQNISAGHYYYAFYVMLTPNAKEMEICSIVDSTKNMWLIESMDINASLIKTSINTRKNIYNNPKASISFSTNNSRVKLEDLNLDLSLQDNDCYEIRNIQKSFMGDSYSFEVVEKKPKLEEPLDTTFNLKISYDQEAFPFVFMTPDNVELEIINQGIRKADITGLGRRNKPVEKMSFKKATYKEPFQGPFRWCRRYLEPTLNIPPYKWCVPDTAITTMPVLISFNEEAMRSHSRIRLEMKGADDIASSHLITYNDGQTKYLYAFAEPDTVDISVKILPGIPTTKFEGKIVAYVENIDEINGIESTSNSMNVGTWSLKYKKGIPFFLWLLWILSLALIVAIVYFIIKSLWLFMGNISFSINKTRYTKYIQKARDYKDVIDDKLSRNLYSEANERINSDGSVTYTSSNRECISCNPNCEVTVKGHDIYASTGGWAKKGKEGLNGYIQEMPNKHYCLDDGATQYRTDSQGRVKCAVMDYNKSKSLPERNGQRDSATERKVVKDKDGYPGQDDGGHLFSREMGGPNESINQVPMEREFQQHGEWRKYEQHEKQICDDAIANGHKVKIIRCLKYNRGSKRPVKIKTKIIIDGKVVKSKTFVNPKPKNIRANFE